MKKTIYYGAFLTGEGRLELLSYLVKNKLMPKEEFRLLLDHCTLLHCSQFDKEPELKEALDYNIEHLKGDIITIGIDAIGKSDKAMAFRVFFGIDQVCANKIPHITICTFAGGKPVNSNDITEWKLLDEPIYVEGYLDKFDTSK